MNRRGDFIDTPGTTPDRVDEALAVALGALRDVVDAVQASPTGECRDALMGQVRVLQHVIGAASAAQAVRIAQFAARGQERTEDGRWAETDLGVRRPGATAETG